MIVSCSMQFTETVYRDKQLNGWTYLDLVEAKGRKLLKTFDYFYYIISLFSADNNFVTGPKHKISSFMLAH